MAAVFVRPVGPPDWKQRGRLSAGVGGAGCSHGRLFGGTRNELLMQQRGWIREQLCKELTKAVHAMP